MRRKHFAFIQILMDTGGKKKNPAKSFLVSSFVVEKSFQLERSHYSK